MDEKDTTAIAIVEQKSRCPKCGSSRVQLYHSAISNTVYGDCVECGEMIWKAVKG